MFSFFKKKKEEIEEVVTLETQENNLALSNEEEKKSFFSRALEKTFATIKTVVPQKKEKISFDDITEEYYSKFSSSRYSCKQIADTLGMTEEDFRKSHTNVSLRGPIKEFVYKRKVRLTDWQEM